MIQWEQEIRRHSEEQPWTYAALDQRQRECAAAVQRGMPGTLLLSELAPVITFGRRTPAEDLAFPRPGGLSTFATDRGGLATWHGPGQWVLFAVASLEHLTGDPRGVKKAVHALLRIAGVFARELVPSSAPRIGEGDELGVWLPHGKFAAVGVHVVDGVLLHGLSVNLYKAPQSFLGLRPCGLDKPVSYLLTPSEGLRRFEETGKQLLALATKELQPERFTSE